MGRKITIVSTKTQSQHVLENSNATTLGELKQELRAAGIDHEDMSFFEGHARVELKDDSSVLPSNIPFKGEVVNDLVFMLSAPDKKIKSGALSRKEAYAEIRRLKLEDTVKKECGRNFTQVPTEDLEFFISKASKKSGNTTTKKEEKKAEQKKEQKAANHSHTSGEQCKFAGAVEKALRELVKILRSSGHISSITAEGINA